MRRAATVTQVGGDVWVAAGLLAVGAHRVIHARVWLVRRAQRRVPVQPIEAADDIVTGRRSANCT